MASLPQVHGVCTPHALVQASDNPAPGVGVQSCRSECNRLTGDKPPWGWHINANERYQPRGKPRTPSSAASGGVFDPRGNKLPCSDFDLFALQAFQIFRAGEVTTLITVPDFGLGLKQGVVHGG